MHRIIALPLFAWRASAYDNGAPHSKMPALGWSSWVALGPGADSSQAGAPIFDFCDEASVKASADAFLKVGLYDAGYRHFHLDDCWADKERNASGFLQAERDHFPNGMKPVVDYVHSLGLTFGLYTCAGTYTCVGGRPGSKDHWEQDANVFAEWGVDWVKMDWCNTKGMTPETTYPKMSEAMNKTGRHMHFNMCEWGKDDPWKWGPNIAQSWRATGDHTGNWDSTKSLIAQRTAIPAEDGGAAYAWNDMDMLETGNYKQAAHANGREGTMTRTEYMTEFSMWAIFASPLTVTTPILNCSKTDQINGNYTPGKCVPSITDLQKEILLNTEVIAINQDVTPAGRLLSKPLEASQGGCALTEQISSAKCALGQTFGCYAKNQSMWIAAGCRGTFDCDGVSSVECNVMNSKFHVCECKAPAPAPAMVYGRKLTDGSIAVALYNPNDVEGFGDIDFSLLGWTKETRASVRDLWQHKDLGTFTDRFPSGPPLPPFVSVGAHATTVLRLTRK
jgi:alpha-galactosidase